MSVVTQIKGIKVTVTINRRQKFDSACVLTKPKHCDRNQAEGEMLQAKAKAEVKILLSRPLCPQRLITSLTRAVACDRQLMGSTPDVVECWRSSCSSSADKPFSMSSISLNVRPSPASTLHIHSVCNSRVNDNKPLPLKLPSPATKPRYGTTRVWAVVESRKNPEERRFSKIFWEWIIKQNLV